MCGRFASQLPLELLARTMAVLGDIPNTSPSWNVAPTQAALVARRHPGYARVSKRDEQNNALQPKALKAAGCRRLLEEAASGGRGDRPELHRSSISSAKAT